MKHPSITSHPKIAIILIILAGGVSSVAYAATTIISDTGIITPTLTITTPGGCSGCGGDGSFSNYNTITLNTTTTNSDSGIAFVLTGNDGGVLIAGSNNNQLIYLNGTTVFSHVSYGANSEYSQISQSSTGKYRAIIDGSGNGAITIYKNGNKLQTLGINIAQFSGGDLGTSQVGVNISPDGHYIAIVGKDSGGAADRVIIYQGS